MGQFQRNRIPSKEFSFSFKDTKLNTNKFRTEKTLKKSVQSMLLNKLKIKIILSYKSHSRFGILRGDLIKIYLKISQVLPQTPQDILGPKWEPRMTILEKALCSVMVPSLLSLYYHSFLLLNVYNYILRCSLEEA